MRNKKQKLEINHYGGNYAILILLAAFLCTVENCGNLDPPSSTVLLYVQKVKNYLDTQNLKNCFSITYKILTFYFLIFET